MIKLLHKSFWTAAACSMFVSVGCYTVLKHPDVRSNSSTVSKHQTRDVSFNDDCQPCHSGSASWSHQAIATRPQSPAASAGWYYYDTPWWYQYYSFGTGASQSENTDRSFDSRRNSRPRVHTETSRPTYIAPLPPATVLARPVQTKSDSSVSDDTNRRKSRGKKRKIRRVSKTRQ